MRGGAAAAWTQALESQEWVLCRSHSACNHAMFFGTVNAMRTGTRGWRCQTAQGNSSWPTRKRIRRYLIICKANKQDWGNPLPALYVGTRFIASGGAGVPACDPFSPAYCGHGKPRPASRRSRWSSATKKFATETQSHWNRNQRTFPLSSVTLCLSGCFCFA